MSGPFNWQPQKADFGDDNLIPKRKLVINTAVLTNRSKVLEEIRFWIQEQGIKIDQTEIKQFSLTLLTQYDKRPPNCVKIIFEKDDNGVVRWDYHSR